MTTTRTPAEELRALETSVTMWPTSDGIATAGESLDLIAQEWTRRFCALGRGLRQQGYSLGLKDVTIGRPIDHVVLDVLRVACGIFNDDETSADFVRLSDVLGRFLHEKAQERPRFQEAVQSVVRRMILFRF